MPSLHGKMLGLPTWVWGVAIGGGIIVGIYMRRRLNQTGTDTGSQDATDGTLADASGSDMSGTASGDVGFPDGYGGVGADAGGGGFSYAPAPAAPPASSRIDPKTRKELAYLYARERAEAKREAERRKRQDKKRSKPRGRVASDTHHLNPPRTTVDHFPTDNHPIRA